MKTATAILGLALVGAAALVFVSKKAGAASGLPVPKFAKGQSVKVAALGSSGAVAFGTIVGIDNSSGVVRYSVMSGAGQIVVASEDQISAAT